MSGQSKVPGEGQRRSSVNTQGFTLFEMLIVLAILGLVAMMTVTLVPSRAPTATVADEARAIAATLRSARTNAIRENRRKTVVFDLDRRSYGAGETRAIPFRPGTVISATVGGNQTTAGRKAAFAFLPDGSSTGGRIELRRGGARAEIGIDWLTGSVETAVWGAR